MITKASFIVIPVFSASIVLRGHLIYLFIGLFIFLALIDIVDIITKILVRRLENKTESTKWRAGVTKKLLEYLLLNSIAVFVYFILGNMYGTEQEQCGMVEIMLSAIPTAFTVLYIIGAIISIAENIIEYSTVKGVEIDRTTLFIIKFFGVAQGKIEKKMIKKIDKK